MPVRRLWLASGGVAMVEFALTLPFLLGVGLYGIETINLVVTTMKINQAATHIADNASRIGDISRLENRRIYESDITDLLLGAAHQTGSVLDLFGRGRVIISSLEVVPDSDDGRNYIHWQRCKGLKVHPSSYGNEGDGLARPVMRSMGPADAPVAAYDDRDAVMFVEVSYDYRPLFSDMFIRDRTIRAHAAFNVRADRDLTQIYQRDEVHPDTPESCDKHDSFDMIAR